MENTTLMGGKYEMSIGSVLIPAQLLGDISLNYEEGMLEAETQAGKRSVPSGKAETAEATFTLFLPNVDYLKTIYAEAYNEPNGNATGNVIFGGGSCSTRTPLPVNIHPVCEDNDDNDFHIYAGLVAMKFNPTLSTSDVVSIETTISMQPTDNGYMRVGTGDLTQESHWDVATQTTVPGPIGGDES